MKRMVFLVMVGVTLVYVIVGAVVFHFLEGINEDKVKRHFAKDLDEFLRAHKSCLNHTQLHEFILKVLETNSEGVAVTAITSLNLSNTNVTLLDETLEEFGTNWDISSSILFCLTIMSTIGYGNMSPKTWSGQLFCIFFALTSIPMYATVLVGIGERLSKCIKYIKKARPWIKSNKQWDSRVKSIVICAVGLLTIALIPSAVFTTTQDWTYLESLYYSVITLTTVGFGDLVPEVGKVKSHNVYRIMLCFWILIGLSWVALILSELSAYFQSKISKAALDTQTRLSNLEEVVKNKAIEAKQKAIETTNRAIAETKNFIKKDSKGQDDIVKELPRESSHDSGDSRGVRHSPGGDGISLDENNVV